MFGLISMLWHGFAQHNARFGNGKPSQMNAPPHWEISLESLPTNDLQPERKSSIAASRETGERGVIQLQVNVHSHQSIGPFGLSAHSRESEC